MNAEPAVRADADNSSYVDWPAIFAGAVAAAAIGLVMLTFGSAVGLSLTDPFGREGVSLFWIAIAMTLWMVWVHVSSFMIGGYITGRMRRRNLDATEHESDVRDGFHGLLVWATAVLFSALLALGGLGGFAQGASSTIGAAAGPVLEQATPEDPFAAAVDVLFRGGEAADPEAARAEAGRIITGVVTGDGIAEDDRAYLAEMVSARTGLTPEEAQARIDDVVARAQAIQDDIEAAAEQASRVGVLLAFLIAATLAVGAAGAWFAATLGGNHRDNQTVVPFFVRRDRPVA